MMRLTFRNYLFAICTLFYLVASNGIPVYLHYCGGELEEISYLTKTNSCCGEEESSDETNDCCKNEGYVLRTQIDGLHFQVARLADLTPSLIDFYCPTAPTLLIGSVATPIVFHTTSPPPLQNSDLIDFTVMRI